MNQIELGIQFGFLFVLLCLSAFFSGSETALMTTNRHKMRLLAKQGHGGAKRAEQLLQRPDRLIGIILLGNNFVNNLATSIATVITLHLFGEGGVTFAIAIFTVVMLIFSEVLPKTFGALHPELLAFPSAYVYKPLLTLLHPLVWSVNSIANGVLRIFGITPETNGVQTISKEELRVVVQEAGAMIPIPAQNMLLGILDLEKISIENIMIPRHEVYGINIQEPIEKIIEVIRDAHYTSMPVYDGSIDNVIGVLHARDVMHDLLNETLTKRQIHSIIRQPYFILEGTTLYNQLLNFQRTNNHIGLVVDEYGDLLGLVTLSDLLEKIVGKFTTDPADTETLIHAQSNGELLIDCSISVRELNEHLHWNLPITGPKTLNGLILEYMETIPEPGTSLMLHHYPLEIIHATDQAVKTVKFKHKLNTMEINHANETSI